MRQFVGVALLILCLIAGDAKSQQETVTCEQVLSYSKATRGWIFLSTMIGYVSGWSDANYERDGEYPRWVFRHRFGTFSRELEVICEHQPKWSLEEAARTAFSDIQIGEPWGN